MQTCPAYRLRLFLSVDLVGSTAYKAGFAGIEQSTQQPKWVSQLKAFYQDFPNVLSTNFQRVKLYQKKALPDACDTPRVWKTVGDEILFCCRVASAQHASVCVKSFVDSLEEYGNHLEAATSGALDVKGSGWLAAFPAPNVTVRLPTKEMDLQEGDEAFEAAADINPSSFDFLGQNIDAGFRTCRNAAGDYFSTSVELAYLLASFSEQAKEFTFCYAGRQSFKGVIGNRPYPVVLIYTERKPCRREIKDKEDSIIGGKTVKAAQLFDFLGALMDDEGIERPCLEQYAINGTEKKPKSYCDYADMWPTENKESGQREKLLNEAEDVADGDNAELPAEIERSAKAIIRSSAQVKASSGGFMYARSAAAGKPRLVFLAKTKQQVRAIARGSTPGDKFRAKPARVCKPKAEEP